MLFGWVLGHNFTNPAPDAQYAFRDLFPVPDDEFCRDDPLVLPEIAKVLKIINIEETFHTEVWKGTDGLCGTDWIKILFYQYLVNYLGNYVEKAGWYGIELEYAFGEKK